MAIDIERIAEAIDHLVTAPMSNWTILKGIPLGTLYAASRSRGGGEGRQDAFPHSRLNPITTFLTQGASSWPTANTRKI